MEPIINQHNVRIDRENAFLLYAAFCGDLERTAHALNVRPMDVLRMADDEKWNDKLRGILELKKSGKPGDIERAINRALNFVQAHRMRMVIERVLKRLTDMDLDELEQYLLQGKVSKDGDVERKLSTRAIADLASALEKCHAMTYAALNDSAPERVKRNDREAEAMSAGEMHVRIAEAMQRAGASHSPRAQLFDAQIAIAEQSAQDIEAKDPANHPNNNDDH